MTGEPGHDTPRDVATRWMLTLVEPLLPLGYRRHLDDEMLAVAATKPRWSSAFFTGVTTNLARSLPEQDPWRHLSARWGSTTFGEHAPERDGSCYPDGRRFGTWKDALDVTGQIVAFPEVDLGLAAVSTPLTTAGSYAVACAGHAPARAARLLLALAADKTDPAGPLPDDADEQTQLAAVVAIDSRKNVDGPAATTFGPAAMDAIRWWAHRRRGYLGVEGDAWLPESVARWSALAEKASTQGLDAHDHESIDRLIAINRVNPIDEDF